MVVGNVPDAVDFVVVGGGPGGYVAALRASRAGRKVLLVDARGQGGLGGVCLREGCIPSKTLIETADLRHRMGTAGALGLEDVRPTFNMSTFQQFKTQVVERLTSGVSALLAKAGVETVDGTFALTDEKTAVISLSDGNVRFVSFQDLILATGSSPLALTHIPFDGETVLDSTHVLSLSELPASLVVIGAGYVGVEIGIALAKLGSKITIVEQADRVLPGMDEALSRPLTESMNALGISLHLNTRAVSFDGEVVSLRSSTETQISTEKVMVAVGRTPNTSEVGLAQAGLDID